MARRRSVAEENRKRKLPVIPYLVSVWNQDVERWSLPSSRGVALLDFPGLIFKRDVLKGRVVLDWNEQPMLVRNVELVNEPNGVIPSLVRLNLVNQERAESGIGSVYLSPKEHAFKLFFRRKDRKLGAVVSRETQAFQGAQPCKIESTFQIVDGIADDECELHGGALVS